MRGRSRDAGEGRGSRDAEARLLFYEMSHHQGQACHSSDRTEATTANDYFCLGLLPVICGLLCVGARFRIGFEQFYEEDR